MKYAIVIAICVSLFTTKAYSQRVNYYNWLDEAIQDSFLGAPISVDGYRWHAVDASLNPVGYASRVQFNAVGLAYWNDLNGSIQARSLASPINPIIDKNDSLYIAFQITYGNESGDAGPWSATRRVTPNSDRKGPDILLDTQWRTGPSRWKLGAHYFSAAVDDLTQQKRLKTILVGNAEEDVIMPLIESQGVHFAYGLDNQYGLLNASASIQNGKWMDFEPVLGFELPYEQEIYEISANYETPIHLDWSLSLNQAYRFESRNTYENAIKYRPSFEVGRHYQSIKLSKNLLSDFFIGARLNSNSLRVSRRQSIDSQLAVEYQANAFIGLKKANHFFQIQTGRMGRNGRAGWNPHQQFDISYGYSLHDWSFGLSFLKEFVADFSMDSRVFMLQNNFNSGVNTIIDTLQVDIERYNRFSRPKSTYWSENRGVSLELTHSRHFNMNAGISQWSGIPFLSTDYQLNQSYPFGSRELLLYNQTAQISVSDEHRHLWGYFEAKQKEIFDVNSYKLFADFNLMFNHIYANRQQAFNEFRIPIAKWQSSFNLLLQMPERLSLRLNYRFRSSLSFEGFQQLEGFPMGAQINDSIIQPNPYRSSLPNLHLINIHVEKRVGTTFPLDLFIHLNGISNRKLNTLHPIGVQEGLTLFIGGRANIF